MGPRRYYETGHGPQERMILPICFLWLLLEKLGSQRNTCKIGKAAQDARILAIKSPLSIMADHPERTKGLSIRVQRN